jgi:hypothetical protein
LLYVRLPSLCPCLDIPHSGSDAERY